MTRRVSCRCPTFRSYRWRLTLLLQKRVVLHPAYLWQSHATHELITLGDEEELIAPGSVDVVLGNSSSISDYMHERMSKLQGAPDGQLLLETELQQYLQYGDALRDEAGLFDETLCGKSAIHPLKWSRDSRFRQLIREGYLLNEIPFGPHLLAIIHRSVRVRPSHGLCGATCGDDDGRDRGRKRRFGDPECD